MFDSNYLYIKNVYFFVDRNIDNERGSAIVDDLKRRILVYEFFVFLHREKI